MPNSEVELCSLALGRLGDDPITSLTDNTNRARLCNAHWPQIRDRLLDEIQPNFAITRVILAQLPAPPAFGAAYQYQVPADCLRPLETDEYTAALGWRREGAVILSDNAAVSLQYLARIEDVTKYTPLFSEACIAVLAATLSYPITKSSAFEQTKQALAKLAVESAQAAEGQEGTSAVLQNPFLVEARGRGTYLGPGNW